MKPIFSVQKAFFEMICTLNHFYKNFFAFDTAIPQRTSIRLLRILELDFQRKLCLRQPKDVEFYLHS